MFKIEKDIPIAPFPRGPQTELRQTLKKMKPRDSILLPRKMRAAARTAALDIFGKGNYATRTNDKNSFRLWRTK